MRLIDADKLIQDGWRLERHGKSGEVLSCMSIADVPTAKETGWTSVYDKMPDEDIFVLVIVNGRHGNIHFENAIQLAEYYKDEGWIIEGYPEFDNPKIEYWQPLPELPEEQQKGE